MPKLIPPDTRLHRSFLAAMAEFQAEGRGGPDDDSNIGQAIRAHASRWAEPAEFTRYLRELEDDAREESPRPAEDAQDAAEADAAMNEPAPSSGWRVQGRYALCAPAAA